MYTSLDNLSSKYLLTQQIFLRKYIILTRNHVIRLCIQNTPVPHRSGYF